MMEKYEEYQLRKARRAQEKQREAQAPTPARPQRDRAAEQPSAGHPQPPETPPRNAARDTIPEPAPRRRPEAPAQPAELAPRPRPAPEPAAQPPESPAVSRPHDPWAAIPEVTLDPRHLDRQRVISAARHDPAHVAFDVLRTRLLTGLRDNGWSRVAITSPTKDCGKTFVAANLALSLSRQEACRSILLDMDLRRPSLAKVLGIKDASPMAEVLTGQRPMSDQLRVPASNRLHIGRHLALGLNSRAENYASELLLDPATPRVLEAMMRNYAPDVVLYDLPPALYYDDVLAFRDQFDGVLLVVGGGITRPQDLRDVKRRLGEDTPLLGVVMNKAEGLSIADYSY